MVAFPPFAAKSPGLRTINSYGQLHKNSHCLIFVELTLLILFLSLRTTRAEESDKTELEAVSHTVIRNTQGEVRALFKLSGKVLFILIYFPLLLRASISLFYFILLFSMCKRRKKKNSSPAGTKKQAMTSQNMLEVEQGCGENRRSSYLQFVVHISKTHN